MTPFSLMNPISLQKKNVGSLLSYLPSVTASLGFAGVEVGAAFCTGNSPAPLWGLLCVTRGAFSSCWGVGECQEGIKHVFTSCPSPVICVGGSSSVPSAQPLCQGAAGGAFTNLISIKRGTGSPGGMGSAWSLFLQSFRWDLGEHFGGRECFRSLQVIPRLGKALQGPQVPPCHLSATSLGTINPQCAHFPCCQCLAGQKEESSAGEKSFPRASGCLC